MYDMPWRGKNKGCLLQTCCAGRGCLDKERIFARMADKHLGFFFVISYPDAIFFGILVDLIGREEKYFVVDF